MPGSKFISRWGALLHRYRTADRGNVAMIFALALIPMCLAAGTGVDFARAMIVRARLSEALDAAALAVGSTPGLSSADRLAKAQTYFDANYVVDKAFGTAPAVKMAVSGQDITLSASVPMPTTLMHLAGIKTLSVDASSTVTWGQTKLWVALVLDNTGSMAETDSTGLSKLSALKSATHQLLTMLQNAAANAGDVKVSIVPFGRDVNVGASNYGASWIDWSDWDDQNTTTTQSCHSNGWRGQTCTTVRTPKAHSTWNGCVMDRQQSYDTLNTAPTNSATRFPAEQYDSCPRQIQALTASWSTLSSTVDGMKAAGNTNQTIGLAWGWQTLTNSTPMNAGALPANTSKVIILLSDGLNTENRWSSRQSSIDDREDLACEHAKDDDITIYTVFVDLNGTSGNSAALRDCATDTSKYFDLTRAGEMAAAFATIGTQITSLHISR
jgi:Flp pilus assembly protein TadG